ncbi:MAG: hypothetical protein ACT4QA_22345 [Panacagrimonas sp.]
MFHRAGSLDCGGNKHVARTAASWTAERRGFLATNELPATDEFNDVFGSGN